MMMKKACWNSRMMKALRREPVDCTPVWMMRQAGRYMKEYREVRESGTFLGLCRNPELCAEVMLTAVEKLGVDAAIIFSDLLPILVEMGLDLEFQKGEGPVIHNAVLEPELVENLRPLEDVHSLDFVFETVRKTRAGLDENLPLIGFSGAPFTLASYAVEGRASRNYLRVKKMMYTRPDVWDVLMSRLTDALISYLCAQTDAGADIVQIFDSWVGCLSPRDYEKYVQKYSRAVIAGVKAHSPETPVIHFTTGNPMLLPAVAAAGGDCIGADWRVEPGEAWRMIGFDRAFQGNLDPAVLLATPSEIRAQVREITAQVGLRPGHVFNLGHGIFPDTPVENAVEFVKIVHDETFRK